MLDSRGLIHVPKPVRVLALVLLGLACACSMVITTYYVILEDPKDPKYSDWVLVGMSIMQLSLTALIAAILLFFTEREVGTAVLKEKTDHFLDHMVPDALQAVSPSYEMRQHGCIVSKLGHSDIFGAAYELESQSHRLKLWVGLNVSRLIVIYWVSGKPCDVELLQSIFHFTFGGAQKVGYTTFFEPATSPAGEPIISIWSSIPQPSNLLLQPSERLFWLQDIAMMTQSFWRTALRTGVATSAEEPSPL